MKTILLEIEDDTYQTILDFIKLLPENRCRIFGEEELSTDEQQVDSTPKCNPSTHAAFCKKTA